MKADIFKGDIAELFDLSTKDALETMKNKQDKTFLLMQREDPLSCSMAGVDKCLADKETRKRNRKSEAEARRQRSAVEKQKSQELVSSASAVTDSASNSTISTSDQEYQAASTRTCDTNCKKRKKILSESVVASVDRVRLSDRSAMFVVGAVAQSLGHPVEELTLSRSSIRRTRIKLRKDVTELDKASFSPQDPLLLHWDSKLLPDIAGGKQKVDRVAVIVTGGGNEKLLAVPEISRGTGQEQADACLRILDDWQLRSHVRGLVFDTTASNTGLSIGACTLLDKSLGSNLVWIPCRHHVSEIILSSVFAVALGPTGGPDVQLFKRFQKQWPAINKEHFTTGSDTLFNSDELIRLREEMSGYYSEALKTQQIRDDYLELLSLCRLFIGGTSRMDIKFRAPGAVHQARWMGKAIYCLKIFVFQEQFVLTALEKKGISDISLFVSLIYGQYWNEAPLAERAPFNDLRLLKQLQVYPNLVIREAAVKAFRRHLWFFSEHLVGLALFDPRVDVAIKKQMVQNLQLPQNETAPHRLDGATVSHDNTLDKYVTECTALLFDLIAKNGREIAVSFLQKQPEEWMKDPVYTDMRKKVQQMKVVNDCAERGIALITEFNASITKNETQKQYLLRLVDIHRKQFPVPSKFNVMKMGFLGYD
jgi:hypothetical protein